MKLLIEMNLSPRWVAPLVDAGIDALHWSTVGSLDAPDLEVEFARSTSLVYTYRSTAASLLAARTKGFRIP
ncbi:MAG: DUF5615 family PIN-like protein [Casimicrobiaceae bacterium]